MKYEVSQFYITLKDLFTEAVGVTDYIFFLQKI